MFVVRSKLQIVPGILTSCISNFSVSAGFKIRTWQMLGFVNISIMFSLLLTIECFQWLIVLVMIILIIKKRNNNIDHPNNKNNNSVNCNSKGTLGGRALLFYDIVGTIWKWPTSLQYKNGCFLSPALKLFPLLRKLGAISVELKCLKLANMKSLSHLTRSLLPLFLYTVLVSAFSLVLLSPIGPHLRQTSHFIH